MKKCEYCEDVVDDKETEEMFHDLKPGFVARIVRNKKLDVYEIEFIGYPNRRIPIRFCPICSRRL